MADEIPEGKRRNGFTGELEDAPKLDLAPSPADQRKLSADQSDDRPLIDKARDVVEQDKARAINVEAPVQTTPHEDITVGPAGVQNVDVPAATTALRQQGAEVAPIEIPEPEYAVKSPNPSPVEEPNGEESDGQ